MYLNQKLLHVAMVLCMDMHLKHITMMQIIVFTDFCIWLAILLYSHTKVAAIRVINFEGLHFHGMES